MVVRGPKSLGFYVFYGPYDFLGYLEWRKKESTVEVVVQSTTDPTLCVDVYVELNTTSMLDYSRNF